MQKVNEYVMHVLCINAKSNAKWISHVIVSAKTLEEAKEAAQKKCEEMNKKTDNIYESRGTGYRLTIGGGCKW